VLFIDARKLATMISRVQCELTDEVIARIAGTVAAWRGEAGAVEYADVAGYCRSVPLAEIAEHGHVLTPGRYVGAEAVEDDDEGFEAKKQALTEMLLVASLSFRAQRLWVEAVLTHAEYDKGAWK